jgi:hypothetical protein
MKPIITIKKYLLYFALRPLYFFFFASFSVLCMHRIAQRGTGMYKLVWKSYERGKKLVCEKYRNSSNKHYEQTLLYLYKCMLLILLLCSSIQCYIHGWKNEQQTKQSKQLLKRNVFQIKNARLIDLKIIEIIIYQGVFRDTISVRVHGF